MKAKDLIVELQTLDPDTEIYIYEGDKIANKYIVLNNISAIESSIDYDHIMLDDIDNQISDYKIWVLI